MLIYDKLDKFAEEFIPDETHPYLHVRCRDMWVTIMIHLIENQGVQPTRKNITTLASKWEQLLYTRFTPLN